MKILAVFIPLSIMLLFTGCMERKQPQQVTQESSQKVETDKIEKSETNTPALEKDTQKINPHEGLKIQQASPGAGHKGKVLSTVNAGGYTYIEVEEKGRKLWVAVMETKVNQGDTVEFPDSPPMENFHSKTLNRTFDKIIFSPSLRVSGK